MNKTKITYFAILTLVIISIGSFSQTSFGQYSFINTTNFANYTSPVLGITLKVPTDWTVIDKENRFEDTIFQINPIDPNAEFYRLMIFDTNIDLEKLLHEMGLENYTKWGLNSMASNANVTIFEDVNMTKYKIGGYESGAFLYTTKYPNGNVTVVRDIGVDKDGDLFHITFQGPPETFDSPKSQELMNYILDSITFNK